MTEKNKTDRTDKMCVYRVMYESGNSLTFREPISPEFNRCTTCDGYDQRCEVYNVLCNATRKFENDKWDEMYGKDGSPWDAEEYSKRYPRR